MIAGAGMEWSPLAPVPDPTGYAGAFAGVSEGALLQAGGTNFPQAPPWEGGAKAWHDRILVLPQPAGAWREAGRLPQPLAHGVSATAPDGVVCAGGSDAARHFATCFRLRLAGGQVAIDPLPALPRPLANMAGAMVATRFLVVGGTAAPADTSASNALFALDLARSEAGWKELPPLPGPGRILPVAAADGDSFFVFSGASLAPGPDGKPARTYLRDAWRFRADEGWKRLADLPRAAVAAPSPAPADAAGHFLILGGDDGTLVHFEPKSKHPGFPRTVLEYDPAADRWAEGDPLPASVDAPVVAPLVAWDGCWIIPGGERRPAVRTTQVLAGRLRPTMSAPGPKTDPRARAIHPPESPSDSPPHP